MKTFQSTHPVWDATSGPVATVGGDRISIHASRMGCDTLTFNDPTVPPYFNPRIPYGMRRPWPPTAATGLSISIHASRMGCDRGDRAAWRKYASHFNPRIPYGMRPASLDPPAACPDFNPRIPYGMRLREWTLHSIIWKFLPALRADYIADIPEHLSVCIFGL